MKFQSSLVLFLVAILAFSNSIQSNECDCENLLKKFDWLAPEIVSCGCDFARSSDASNSANEITKRQSCVESYSTFGQGTYGSVYAIMFYKGDLYVGGTFLSIGGIDANYVAKWNGTDWSALDSGMDNGVYGMEVFQDTLYFVGTFIYAGGYYANKIAAYNGSLWVYLSNNANVVTGGYFYTLKAMGDSLYVAGYFTSAMSSKNILRWDGLSFYNLDSGVDGAVVDMVSIGNDLYVGGYFIQAGGNYVSRVAKWNGTWSALSTGVNNIIVGMGSIGNDLYIGGEFTVAGGSSITRIAKWNGTNFSPLGSGMEALVNAIVSIGNTIYAAGNFIYAGGVTVNHVAKWDGSSWSAMGSGTDQQVYTLMASTFDVYLGGAFVTVSGTTTSPGITKWNGCQVPTPQPTPTTTPQQTARPTPQQTPAPTPEQTPEPTPIMYDPTPQPQPTATPTESQFDAGDSLNSSSENDGAAASVGMIVGIVVGVICFLICCVVLMGILCLVCIARKQRQSTDVPLQERKSPKSPKSPYNDVEASANTQSFLDRISIPFSDITIERELGKGEFGIVYLASKKEENAKIACKQIAATPEIDSKASIASEPIRKETKAFKEFIAEAKVLQSMPPSPFVAKFIGLCSSPFCILTEFVDDGCSLASYLTNQNNEVSQKTSIGFLKQICRGIAQLHKNGIVHRDLAARNVLLRNTIDTPTGVRDCVLVDAGLARLFETDENYLTSGKKSPIPLKWAAPEVWKEKKFSEKSDMYAFGIIAIECFTRNVPFPTMTEIECVTAISVGKLVPTLSGICAENYASVLNHCLSLNANSRPQAPQLVVTFVL